MISPNCAICNKELEDYGAILLSPPNKNNDVKKSHICKDCYNRLKSEKNLK